MDCLQVQAREKDIKRLIRLLADADAFSPMQEDRISAAFFKEKLLEWEKAGTPFRSPGGPTTLDLHADAARASSDEKNVSILIDVLTRRWVYYRRTGHAVCAIAARNLCEVLRAASRSDLEREFLNAYDKHFRSRWGSINSWLIDRMIELDARYDPQYDAKLALLASNIENIAVSVKEIRTVPGSTTQFHFEFETECLRCGGWMLRKGDDDEEDPSCRCTACGAYYGKFSEIRAFCEYLGQMELKRRRLGAFASLARSGDHTF